MESILEQAGAAANSFARTRAFARGNPRELGRLQKNCDLHGPYMSTCIDHPTSMPVWSPCPLCLSALEQLRCEQRAAADEQERRWKIAERIERAQVPRRFHGRRFDDFKAEQDGQQKVLALARKFVAEFHKLRQVGTSMVFAGTPGTGKSLLAMIVLQEICQLAHGCRYTTCQGLIQSIRATWGKDGEGREREVVDEFAEVGFLVIDEIGVQAGTDNEKALLFEIIDRRYSDMRPTLFVTNLDKAEFQAFIGDRLWDRLVEVASWVPFAWDSYRPTARREMAEALAAGAITVEEPSRRSPEIKSPWSGSVV